MVVHLRESYKPEKPIEHKERTQEFEVGDRVECIVSFPGLEAGYTGTIENVNGLSICVIWDQLIEQKRGHRGTKDRNYGCWYALSSSLKRID